MANYTAADVKKLREETDAPMMECKTALDEADGDMDKARQILREKGKSAAAKRADRTTAAGVVAFASSPDGKTVGAVVVECETDFVARNEEFNRIVQEIAGLYLEQPSDLAAKVQEKIEEAVNKIRENIRVAKGTQIVAGTPVATYVHHDKTKGAAVVIEGADAEVGRKIAVQIVSLPPDVISKDQLSQEKLDSEIEIEKQRAINEGKDEKIADGIARGRVNKEFVKKAVLLEQVFYADQQKSVAQYLQESAKGAKILRFEYLAIGAEA